MTVRVKLDENLSRSHVELLRKLGHEVDRVFDQGLSGASDSVVWSRVVEEGRFFVTLDLDFSDVRRYEPGTHPGILLLRARTNSGLAVEDILRRVLAEQALDELRGCLVIADHRLTRIRRPRSDSGDS